MYPGAKYEGAWLMLAVGGPIVFGPIGAVVVGVSGANAIKSITAPRLVVLDYVRGVAK